jgi:hypothetical protein
MKKIILFVLGTVCFLELFFRCFLFVTSPSKMLTNGVYLYAKYYPNLSKISNYSYDNTKLNVLVLGGSVVYDDTIPFNKNSRLNLVSFCGFKELDSSRYNILNLAYPAHTSLDSKYKFRLLENYNFDYVFVYHGINDARSNNIDSLGFDEYYRHIEFYDGLYLLEKHPEVKYYASLYMFDLISFKMLNYFGAKDYMPREFLSFLFEKDSEIIEKYFNKECRYFTEISFYNNMKYIVDLGIERNIRPILFTYAYYQPKDYTIEKFFEGSLDYATNFFPTELYGDPICIPLIVEKHNNQIKNLQNHYLNNVLFLDFNEQIEKGEESFMDVCHLTKRGCDEMYESIVTIVEDRNSMELLNKEVLNLMDK